MNIRVFFIHTHTHIFICAFEADALCEHIWCEADLEGVYCCAHGSRCRWHLLNTFSHSLPVCSLAASLPLSLYSPCLFFYRSLPFFCSDQMERCSSPSPSHSGSQCCDSCDPACYLLPLYVSFSLSLSIHKRPLSLFPSVLFPRQRQTKAFHFS